MGGASAQNDEKQTGLKKKPKTGPGHSEKWHRTTKEEKKKKKKSIFEIETKNRCAKHKTIWWDSHFLVYKQGNNLKKKCTKQALKLLQPILTLNMARLGRNKH